MAVTRIRRIAQILALILLVGLSAWHYLLRHYDMILPPALLAAALLVLIPLQRLGRLRQPLADAFLLVGVCLLFTIEAPEIDHGMLWLGLPVVAAFLLLPAPVAIALNLLAVPAWLAILDNVPVSLLNLSLGWGLTMATGATTLALARQERARQERQASRDCGLRADELKRCLDIEISRARAFKRPLSVLVLYVPQLDRINDEFGNQSRHVIWEAFSDVVADNSRHSDLFGEPRNNIFWLVMPNAEEDGALLTARRLTAAVTNISRPETGALESFKRVCTLRPHETQPEFTLRLEAAANKLLEPQA